ncbi:MAG TPA: ABC transporter permease [Candidatus Sulfotelmatobacter sp.]|jgi:ABC-2 type transport system permease protein
MTSPSNATLESLGSPRIPTPASSAPHPFYWSVRRELWENRSLYIAPLAVAALILVGFLISMVHLPEKMRAAMALSDHMQRQDIIEKHYNVAALLLMGTFLIVAVFYCLDALYGERRDRSILFWKSMPVSDLTVVLSKASVPLLLLPLLTWAITVVIQVIMLLLSTVALLTSGQSVAALWTHLPLIRMSVMLLYHLLFMHGLYYAPFYGWMLLVSAWARRAPLLWASLPLLAIGFVEKIAFNTSHFGAMLLARFVGGPAAIDYPAQSSAMQNMTPFTLAEFLLSPGLWIGLIVAAAFLAGAVRLRRYRDPI